MKKRFTLNDVLLYHYNELSSAERLAFEHQMKFDEELKNESRKIAGSLRFLNSAKRKPSDSSIRYILDHNRKSSGELNLC